MHAGQGIAKALEHRSRKRAKGVEKRLSAAAQRRWQGKSLTDEAKIDALNEGKTAWLSEQPGDITVGLSDNANPCALALEKM